MKVDDNYIKGIETFFKLARLQIVKSKEDDRIILEQCLLIEKDLIKKLKKLK